MCFRSSFPGGTHWNRYVSPQKKHLTSCPFFHIYKANTSTFLSPEMASQTFIHKKSLSWKRRTWTFSCQKFHFGFVFLSDWFWRDSTMGIHHHFVTTIWETIFSGNFFGTFFFGKNPPSMRTFDLHLSIASHRDPGFGSTSALPLRDYWNPPNGSGWIFTSMRGPGLQLLSVVEVSQDLWGFKWTPWGVHLFTSEW